MGVAPSEGGPGRLRRPRAAAAALQAAGHAALPVCMMPACGAPAPRFQFNLTLLLFLTFPKGELLRKKSVLAFPPLGRWRDRGHPPALRVPQPCPAPPKAKVHAVSRHRPRAKPAGAPPPPAARGWQRGPGFAPLCRGCCGSSAAARTRNGGGPCLRPPRRCRALPSGGGAGTEANRDGERAEAEQGLQKYPCSVFNE